MFMKRMMGSISKKTSRFITSVTRAIITKETKMLDLSFSSLRSPYRMENTAPLPMHSPSRMEVKKVISVKALPTAARACAPRNCPTISVSAML